MKTAQFVQTPLGTMTLVEENGTLIELRFAEKTYEDEHLQFSPLLRKAEAELSEYFAGKRNTFTVPLAPKGTAFQQSVWKVLAQIPYGDTMSYGEVAKRIGNPKAARAVGLANNRNPLPVFIPCHRVIGADGSMVGYGGGLYIKESLLALETKAIR